jgi:NAD(P)-dependent dehydrogenase (short-subunit alcohol dehydrogenase family)
MSVYDIFDIKGRKALVTGAGRGIGRVLATALAEAGCDVALFGLHHENLEPLSKELGNLGVKTLVLTGDVSLKKDVDAAFAAVKQYFGRLDICVNNAGVSMQVPAEDMAEADWDRLMDVNLKGAFLCSQAAARIMIPQQSGSIINIGSISASAVNVPQKQGVYNTSKAGVVHLSRSLAVEWAPHHVRVNSLSPGYIKTEMTLSTMAKLFPAWEALTPLGRLGTPEELRGALLFMASDASSYMTGHDLVVDGGYLAR